MKLKQNMFTKTFKKIRVSSTVVIIQKIAKSYDKTNKKVIGKFKDEAGEIITEFVGLRSKMYSYIKDNGENGKTAKEIKKIVIKKNIHHVDYKNTLFNSQQMYHKMKTIKCVAINWEAIN